MAALLLLIVLESSKPIPKHEHIDAIWIPVNHKKIPVKVCLTDTSWVGNSREIKIKPKDLYKIYEITQNRTRRTVFKRW